MIFGLNAGFGLPLAHELPALKTLGVQLVRTDCQQRTPEQTRDRVLEISDAGLVPFPIVRNAEQVELLPSGTNVELRNEPDLNGPSPADYEWEVTPLWDACERLGLFLWAGAVSNLNARGLRYLTEAHVERWPALVSVSVHRYANGDSPNTPHQGFRTRGHEVEELKRIIGTRTWGVSEFGFSTANRATKLDKLLWRKRQWTDAQVAEFVAFEFNFWAKQGALGAALYQLNDGPTNTVLDRYGIRRIDGTWKPSSETFKESLA